MTIEEVSYNSENSVNSKSISTRLLMSPRNLIALFLILASLVCLYPGLFQEMLTIKVSREFPLIGQMTLYEATQSIVQTIETLYLDQNYVVAGLILLFSVLVPLIKVLLLLLVLFSRNLGLNRAVLGFVSAITKWSMADVFVVGVFIAYLSTRSNESIEASLHGGFYYFTAYCLLSILGTQLVERPNPQETLS